MIKNFRHKGLEQYYLHGRKQGIPQAYEQKIRRILSRMEAAKYAEDLNHTGYKLHALKGDMKGYWSVWVTANWRIIFRFEDGEFRDIELIDYH